MFCGRVARYDALEIRCESSASGSSFSNLGTETLAYHCAQVSSPTTPDAATVATGLSLSGWAKWSLDGSTAPSAHFAFQLGELTDSRDFGEALPAFQTVLRLLEPALYVNGNGVWEWHIAGVEWEIGGALAGVYAGGTFYGSMAVSPMSMPLFTGVLTCQSLCTLETGAYGGVITPGNEAHSSVVAHATLGYRVKIGGSFYAFPAQLLDVSMPSALPGVVTTSVDGLASITDANTVLLTSEASMGDGVTDIGVVASNGWDVWRQTQTSADRSATVTLVADPGFGVERLNPDYAELVYRGAMPGARAHGRYTYFFDHPHAGDPDEYSTTVTLDTDVLAPLSEFLDRVTNAPSPIEDAFRPNVSWPALQAGAAQASSYYIVPPGVTEISPGYTNPSGVTVDDPDPRPFGAAGASFSFPVILEAPGAVLGNLVHLSGPMTLLNTAANPLWSMLLFFPSDGLGSESANAWPADGIPRDPGAYWLPLREQQVRNSLLPAEVGDGNRLQIVSECLSTNGLAGLMCTLSGGALTSYWGVSRFETRAVQPPSEVACSRHEAWSVFPADAAAMTFDADGVTLSPAVPAFRVRLDLFAFGEGQGLANGLADAAILDWDALPEGVSLQAAWVAYDGSRAEIDLTPGPGVRYGKPQALAKHYMDSSVEDWTTDDVPDLGRDLKATGMSEIALADADRGLIAEAFQPFGSNRQYLRLEFQITGAAEDLRLAYPRLTSAVGSRALVYDRSQRGILLTAGSGPVRWGAFAYLDPMTLAVLDWPIRQARALAPSALDGFGFAANLEGQPCGAGLSAAVAARFDEGIEYTQLKHLAVDPISGGQVTHSFLILGSAGLPVVALVNSYREVPPLAAFPNPVRNRLDWSPVPASGFECRAFSWGQARRYLAEPTPPDGGPGSTLSDLSLREESAPAGWRLASFRIPSPTNSESDTRLRFEGVDYVAFRPWSGLLWTLGIPPSPSRSAGYDVARSMRQVRTFVPHDSPTFWIGATGSSGAWGDRDSGKPATWARPRFADLGEERIGVMYGDGDLVHWARTRDLGVAWADDLDLGEGAMGDYEEGASGLKWFYKLVSPDGGASFDVWGQLRDNALTVVRDWTITNLTGLDDAPIAVRESLGPDGAWRLGLLHFVGGEPTTKYSRDGLEFS